MAGNNPWPAADMWSEGIGLTMYQYQSLVNMFTALIEVRREEARGPNPSFDGRSLAILNRIEKFLQDCTELQSDKRGKLTRLIKEFVSYWYGNIDRPNLRQHPEEIYGEILTHLRAQPLFDEDAYKTPLQGYINRAGKRIRARPPPNVARLVTGHTGPRQNIGAGNPPVIPPPPEAIAFERWRQQQQVPPERYHLFNDARLTSPPYANRRTIYKKGPHQPNLLDNRSYGRYEIKTPLFQNQDGPRDAFGVRVEEDPWHQSLEDMRYTVAGVRLRQPLRDPEAGSVCQNSDTRGWARWLDIPGIDENNAMFVADHQHDPRYGPVRPQQIYPEYQLELLTPYTPARFSGRPTTSGISDRLENLALDEYGGAIRTPDSDREFRSLRDGHLIPGQPWLEAAPPPAPPASHESSPLSGGVLVPRLPPTIRSAPSGSALAPRSRSVSPGPRASPSPYGTPRSASQSPAPGPRWGSYTDPRPSRYQRRLSSGSLAGSASDLQYQLQQAEYARLNDDRYRIAAMYQAAGPSFVGQQRQSPTSPSPVQPSPLQPSQGRVMPPELPAHPNREDLDNYISFLLDDSNFHQAPLPSISPARPPSRSASWHHMDQFPDSYFDERQSAPAYPGAPSPRASCPNLRCRTPDCNYLHTTSVPHNLDDVSPNPVLYNNVFDLDSSSSSV